MVDSLLFRCLVCGGRWVLGGLWSVVGGVYLPSTTVLDQIKTFIISFLFTPGNFAFLADTHVDGHTSILRPCRHCDLLMTNRYKIE